MSRTPDVIVEWDGTRPVFADVNHHHPLLSPAHYAEMSACGLIGVKVSQDGAPADMGVQMVQAAERAGLVVLGYQFGPRDPDGFLKLFPPGEGRIPCLDFEGEHAVGPGAIARAEAFVRAVEAAHGRGVWFYAGREWSLAGEPGDTAMALCPWWGPQYGPHLRVRRGVGRPVAWQFSDGVGGPEGAPRWHAGVRGACDMSALLITIDEMRLMAGIERTVA